MGDYMVFRSILGYDNYGMVWYGTVSYRVVSCRMAPIIVYRHQLFACSSYSYTIFELETRVHIHRCEGGTQQNIRRFPLYTNICRAKVQ